MSDSEVENTAKTILKVNDLSIGYDSSTRRTIVSENIDLDIKEAQLIGIVGANGIGKSTLVRTLSGMQPKLSGKISLQGKDLEKLDVLERAKLMSLVLTEQMISKNLTVVELVSLGRQPYTNWYGKLTDDDISVINSAISLTGLAQIQNKPCSELSDGQLQKVMIARAFAQETALILMDEPTTHLDLYHKAYIMRLLKDLVVNSKKTIIFSSHEIDLVIQLCDKMVVMTDRNVFFDTPCNLILSGIFDDLFPQDLITFDPHSGSFKMNRTP